MTIIYVQSSLNKLDCFSKGAIVYLTLFPFLHSTPPPSFFPTRSLLHPFFPLPAKECSVKRIRLCCQNSPLVSPGCRNADTHNLYHSIEESSKFHLISHKKNIEQSTRHYGRPKNGIAPVDLCTISPQDGSGMYPSPGADAIT